MKKHGLSHAIGAFLSSISAFALSNLIEDTMPEIYALLFNLSSLIRNLIPSVPEKIIGYAILASLLMFIWGVGFYFAHKD